MNRHASSALALALSTALAAGSALADTPKKALATPCFFITQWEGWKAPDAHTLYLGVNMHDVYKVELSGDSPMIQDPDMHLISEVHGSTSICTALDLQLSVSDSHGFREPLIAKTLTKLSPEEVKAIPKKYRPN
jgi:hypothetical protein